MYRSLFFTPVILLTFIVKGQLKSDSLLIEGHYRTFHFNKPIKET